MFTLQSHQANTSFNTDSSLMRALDLGEQGQFKGMKENKSLLKVVEARNRKCEEYNESMEFWPKETFMEQLEEKQNEVQSLAQQINNLKKQFN